MSGKNTSSQGQLPAVRHFDPHRVASDDGTVRIAIEFNPRRPKSRPPVRAGFESSGYRVEYEFALTDDGTDIEPLPIAASLVFREGLHPSELRRFAWTRWAPLAEAHARSAVAFTMDRRDATIDQQQTLERRLGIVKLRPGRGGHPPEHYEAIAARYRVLASQYRNPTDRIAKEHNVSRATVAGWIREARRRNLLPPARKGRAG